MSEAHGGYYVPHKAPWPIVGSIGLTTLMVGFASLLIGHSYGGHMMIAGAVIIAIMMFGWFGSVIRENLSGMYNEQVDRSFRWGMGWFIFSEVMFFAAFFGALFYIRMYSVPWLGGIGDKGTAHTYLWPHFFPAWPTNGPADLGGHFEPMPVWGIAAINTLILLSSSVTVTWSHWALKAQQRGRMIFWLACTVLLGLTFLGMQAHEYIDAYTHLHLTLHTGVYGSTFFMLTGFHGAHVTIGATMLTVMLVRAIKGHFTPDNHFAFEAAAWYWHFVDVVWLCLFVFVYWL